MGDVADGVRNLPIEPVVLQHDAGHSPTSITRHTIPRRFARVIELVLLYHLGDQHRSRCTIVLEEVVINFQLSVLQPASQPELFLQLVTWISTDVNMLGDLHMHRTANT